MNTLYELSIVRSKLVIKQLREITLHDLVAVRETLNSIDFILGDDDKWDYAQLPKSWKATTKVRLYYADQILQFLKDNKGSIKLESIDQTFLIDLTKAHKIEIEGKTEQELKAMDKDKLSSKTKENILKELDQTVANLNELAETMGEIL